MLADTDSFFGGHTHRNIDDHLCKSSALLYSRCDWRRFSFLSILSEFAGTAMECRASDFHGFCGCNHSSSRAD